MIRSRRTNQALANAVCCYQEALAPYKHIEEDLKSLKEVLEMKNQQIHQQDLKISELEKIVSFKCLHWCYGRAPSERVCPNPSLKPILMTPVSKRVFTPRCILEHLY